MLNCHIVRDLLPSYLEHLTAPETEAELAEHLAACPDCRAVKAAMEADLEVEKAPKPRRDFLRHLRWQRRLAALLTLLAAILCLHWLYQEEYPDDFSPTTAELREVIAREMAPQLEREEGDYYRAEVRVAETREVGDRLFVLYRLEREGVYLAQGYFQFERGPLGRYHLYSRCSSGWPLAAQDRTEIEGEACQVVYCALPVRGAETFRAYLGYRAPKYEGEETADYRALTPLCEGSAGEPFLAVIPLTEEQAEEGFLAETSVVYFDAEGEAMDLYELAEQQPQRGHSGSAMEGYSHRGNLLRYSALILLLAAALLRYFLRK